MVIRYHTMIYRSSATRPSRRVAFTLLEVLIVVAIIVMLAGAGTYYFLQRLEDGKEGIAKASANQLAAAAEQFYAKNQEFPASLDVLAQPQADGSGAYFPPDKLLDPWRKPFQYDPSGQHNGGNKPDVWTTTPKGKVVGNW